MHAGRIELIALRQILPPSCCVLQSADGKNDDVRQSAIPKNFSTLLLEDFTCPHTGEGSMAGQVKEKMETDPYPQF